MTSDIAVPPNLRLFYTNLMPPTCHLHIIRPVTYTPCDLSPTRLATCHLHTMRPVTYTSCDLSPTYHATCHLHTMRPVTYTPCNLSPTHHATSSAHKPHQLTYCPGIDVTECVSISIIIMDYETCLFMVITG